MAEDLTVEIVKSTALENVIRMAAQTKQLTSLTPINVKVNNMHLQPVLRNMNYTYMYNL